MVAAKIISAKCIACEIWVDRVGAFAVVLYRNQWPVDFILRFVELHCGSSISYSKFLCLKFYKVKRI